MRLAQSRQLIAAVRFGLLSSLAALTLFSALEVTARLYLFGWAGLDPRRVPLMRGLAPQGMLRGSRDQPYRLFHPDLDVFANLVRVRTNSRGLRDEEYSFAKPVDTFRVAVMGSSFTIPFGVEIEDAYHSVLEERLSAKRAPTQYEFINFATSVIGPSRLLTQLRTQALSYEPDLILVGATRAVVPYYLLEWRGSPRSLPRKYRWPPAGLHRFARSLHIMGFRSYFVRMVRTRSSGVPRLRVHLEPPATGPRPDDVVMKLAEVGRTAGIPVVVCRLAYDPTRPDPVENRFAARVVAEGMYYIDTRDAFRGKTPTDFWIHQLDRHPDPRAHAIFADVIEEFLELNDLLGP